jgi:hypothetical protein
MKYAITQKRAMKTVAADPVCRDQAASGLCAGKPGRRLKDEPHVNRANQNKGDA